MNWKRSAEARDARWLVDEDTQRAGNHTRMRAAGGNGIPQSIEVAAAVIQPATVFEVLITKSDSTRTNRIIGPIKLPLVCLWLCVR
jgi:hypothetical protein